MFKGFLKAAKDSILALGTQAGITGRHTLQGVNTAGTQQNSWSSSQACACACRVFVYMVNILDPLTKTCYSTYLMVKI